MRAGPPPSATGLRPGVTRRTALGLLGLGAGLLGGGGPAAAAILPAPGSLASALAAALMAGQPLVVMASLDGCPFCHLVRDNYLAPLRRDSGLPVVQLDLASRESVIDFSGAASSHGELLQRWGVLAAPTVLFFGRAGREVAPRLVGASVDFYGSYLEQRLAVARNALG